MLPEKTNYLYYVALASSVFGLFPLVIGVFWSSWFVLHDEDARVLEVFSLFDDITCFENYCVSAYMNEQQRRTGWLLMVQALLVFNVIFLLMGVVQQINHASLPSMQHDLFLSCVVLLGTSICITAVTTILVGVKIRTLSTYQHPQPLFVLNLQSTPLLILLLSTPSSFVSIALLIHGSVASKQKPKW